MHKLGKDYKMAKEFGKFLRGELPEQLIKEKQIYHILVIYRQSLKNGANMTGHMVMGKSPEQALEIANKHHIGNPMGEINNIKVRTADTQPRLLNDCLKRKGNIWFENNFGKLKGIKE